MSEIPTYHSTWCCRREDPGERENAFSMKEFAASVNEFLTFRRYALLPDKGKVSREMADKLRL